MSQRSSPSLKSFAIELVVYAFLVTGYFFLVLHLLGGWLKEMSDHHRIAYAFVAVALVVGQAVVLESVTTTLLHVIRKGKT